MIGQRLALRRCIRSRRVCVIRAGSALGSRHIAVEIFQCERELIGIEALGATPELRALKLS